MIGKTLLWVHQALPGAEKTAQSSALGGQDDQYVNPGLHRETVRLQLQVFANMPTKMYRLTKRPMHMHTVRRTKDTDGQK